MEQSHGFDDVARIVHFMKNMAYFYMRFPMQDYGLMDFNKLKEIAETGYSYACEKLSEWEKTVPCEK